MVGKMLTKRAALMILFGVAVLALPASALGSGGASIASAPTVVYGEQLFGNTAIDDGGKTLSNCVDGESWWSMPVLAGDQIKVDYEGGLDEMQAWGVGTTDFNIHDAPDPQQFRIGSKGKAEAIVKASVAGIMPLRFFSVEGGLCEIFGGPDEYAPGPYDFTATVQHALAAALTPIASIYTNSTLAGTASLADGTALPDGVIFSLVAKWPTASAAYSAATVGGTLAFPLALPPETAGKTIRIVITRAEDTSYQAVKSVPLKVKVANPPASGCTRAKRHAHVLARQRKRLSQRARFARGTQRRRLQRRARRIGRELHSARRQAGRACAASG